MSTYWWEEFIDSVHVNIKNNRAPVNNKRPVSSGFEESELFLTKLIRLANTHSIERPVNEHEGHHEECGRQ